MAAMSLCTARHDERRQGCPIAKHAAVTLMIGVALFATTSAELVNAGDDGSFLQLKSTAAKANPPLPDPSLYPVQLVLDDDNADGVFGFAGSEARQFLWFNQFSNPGPFVLEEIWVLFPSSADVPPDGNIDLVVYLDPDGDPTNGAQLLATFSETIQEVTGDDFSVYPLSSPVTISDPGDVLIGVINRYFIQNTTPPPTFPVALDAPTSQDRSFFALWTGDVPPMPDLATADTVDLFDGLTSGNCMIRGFGTNLSQAAPIPTLSSWGILAFIALVAVAGVCFARLRFV